MSNELDKLFGYQVHPAAKIFPLMVASEFEAFADDIRDNGLLEKAVLWKKGGQDWLIDGRNRLRACHEVGVKPAFTYFKGDDPFSYVVSQNLHRRQMSESQRAMVGARIKEMIEKENPPDKGGRPTSSEKPEANRPQVRKPQARDQAAQMVNVGGRSVQRAAKVIEHGHPKLQGAVDAGIVRVDLAAQIADKPQAEQEEVIRKIAGNPTKNARAILREHDRDAVASSAECEGPMPEGPFCVLLVDFPWAHGKRGGEGTMSKGDIELFAETRIRPMANEDAVLFLCITDAHLASGDHVAVLKAAGFTGKTMLIWDRERMGTDDWLRGQTRHIIMATKGRPTVRSSSKTTVVPMFTDQPREPGQKPEELYGFIESLCPGNRVELFSRSERKNWTAWIAETSTLDSEGDR